MLTLKRYVLLVFLVMMFFSIGTIAYSTELSKQPTIRADGALVMDAQSGKVLYEKNGYHSMHPASLTKIMTALLAIEKGNLNDQVIISDGPPKIYIGSILKLKKGEIITLGDLVKAALIVSANDSTIAISEHIGGNQELFIQWMNQKACSIGAYNTRYVNTNGYSKPNHKTTPYDLALISRYALNNRTFAKVVSTKEDIIFRTHFIRNKKTVQDYPIRNTNRLLWHSQDIIGIKTGTTTSAGGCLITASNKNGHKLISVVLRSSKRYQDTINILDYGYNNYLWINKLKTGQLIGKCRVKKGKIKNVNIIAQKGLYSIVPVNEIDKTNLKIKLPGMLKAPITKGQVIGKGIIYDKGQIIDQVNLITEREVKKD